MIENAINQAEVVRTGPFSRELRTEILIAAPADVVWTALTDLDSYHLWNPFVIEAEGTVEENAKLAVRIQPAGRKASSFTPTVTEVTPHRVFEWLGRVGVPHLFDGRHRFELEPTADGAATRLRQSEQFSGALAPLLMKLIADSTIDGFTQMNEALKARVEATVSAEATR